MTISVARFDAYRTLAFGSIGATYSQVGTATAHIMRIVHFVNNTNADVDFSFDGVNDNIFCSANSFVLYDLEANGIDLQVGTPFLVKYHTGAPTSGAVFVMTIYAKGQ